MTKPPIPTENSKTEGQHTQTPPKTSITQRLRTDLGRSVGVTSNPTGVVKLVWLVGTPLDFGHELVYRLRVAQPTLIDVTRFFDILLYYYMYICLCTTFYDISTFVGCFSSVSIKRIIYKFLNMCPFDYTAFAVSGKVGYPLTGLSTPVNCCHSNWTS